MLRVIGSVWALMLGMLLLMVGNGLQGSLIGIRGAIEEFSTNELAVVTSAYFVGFLFGSRVAPALIRRVGHVRVFAALGSLISAMLILYPMLAFPWAWILMRAIIGFSFSGVYVTAESWLNNASPNESRGRVLSLYMIVQMSGMVSGQALLNLADPAGFELFIIPSVLVSFAFVPILLAATPTPAFEAAKAMNLVRLCKVSPTGVVGMFLLGLIFSAQFGMATIYGTQAGFTVSQIALFVSAILFGGMVLQYPFGWLSDRIDRRALILAAAVGGSAGGAIGLIWGGVFELALVAGFVAGGASNPLYALLIAYTNDCLEPDDMASASGGLIFVNGLGAIIGPIIVGQAMSAVGPNGFWAFMAGVMLTLVACVAYRMGRRPSIYAADDASAAVSYAPVLPTATPVVVEAAQEIYAESAEAGADGDLQGPG